MMIYYMLIFSIAMAGIKYEQDKRTNSYATKNFLMFCWIAMSLVEGLRGYRVGSDTPSYVAHFSGRLGVKFELGYEILVAGIRLITSNQSIFLLIIALIINGLVLLGIYLNSDDPMLSVLFYISLYYYMNSFNATRQYIAVPIIFISFYFAVRRKWVKFVLLVLLAMQFHKTAIVGFALCVCGIINSKNNRSSESGETNRKSYVSYRNELFLIIGTTIVASYIVNSKLGVLSETLFNIFPEYQVYNQSDYFVRGGGIQQPIVYTLIWACLVLFVPANNKKLRLIIFPMCIAVVLAFVQRKILFGGRFLWYFDIFSIVALPTFIKESRFTKESKKFVHFATVTVCLMFMTYYLANEGQMAADYYFAFM